MRREEICDARNRRRRGDGVPERDNQPAHGDHHDFTQEYTAHEKRSLRALLSLEEHDVKCSPREADDEIEKEAEQGAGKAPGKGRRAERVRCIPLKELEWRRGVLEREQHRHVDIDADPPDDPRKKNSSNENVSYHEGASEPG